MTDETHAVPGPRFDMSDPVVARYIRDRARQAAYDGGAPIARPDTAPQAGPGLSMASAAFSPALGMAAMKFAQDAADLSRTGDHAGAERATRVATRLAVTAMAVGLGSGLLALVMLWFAG